MKRLLALALVVPLLAACPGKDENDDRFHFCVSHGGTFRTHGSGSTFECVMPTTVPATAGDPRGTDDE